MLDTLAVMPDTQKNQIDRQITSILRMFITLIEPRIFYFLQSLEIVPLKIDIYIRCHKK